MKARWIAAALSAAMWSVSAHALTTLTFDGDICNGGNACANGASIDQGYGDVAGQLDVVYDRMLGTTVPGTAAARLTFWTTQFSDLVNVAYGGTNDVIGVAEIFLQPAPGYQVSLLGFAFGAWPNNDRITQVTILTGAGAPIFKEGPPLVVNGQTHSSFTFSNATAASGIRIQWGPTAFNVGIDNIAFDVTVVPEPSTYALLLAGLGVVGLIARRRSR